MTILQETKHHQPVHVYEARLPTVHAAWITNEGITSITDLVYASSCYVVQFCTSSSHIPQQMQSSTMSWRIWRFIVTILENERKHYSELSWKYFPLLCVCYIVVVEIVLEKTWKLYQKKDRNAWNACTCTPVDINIGINSPVCLQFIKEHPIKEQLLNSS